MSSRGGQPPKNTSRCTSSGDSLARRAAARPAQEQANTVAGPPAACPQDGRELARSRPPRSEGRRGSARTARRVGRSARRDVSARDPLGTPWPTADPSSSRWVTHLPQEQRLPPRSRRRCAARRARRSGCPAPSPAMVMARTGHVKKKMARRGERRTCADHHRTMHARYVDGITIRQLGTVARRRSPRSSGVSAPARGCGSAVPSHGYGRTARGAVARRRRPSRPRRISRRRRGAGRDGPTRPRRGVRRDRLRGHRRPPGPRDRPILAPGARASDARCAKDHKAGGDRVRRQCCGRPPPEAGRDVAARDLGGPRARVRHRSRPRPYRYRYRSRAAAGAPSASATACASSVGLSAQPPLLALGGVGLRRAFSPRRVPPTRPSARPPRAFRNPCRRASRAPSAPAG